MADGTKLYEYENIEACAEAIKRAVSDMEEQVNQVAQQTRTLFGDGWGGTAAQAYDQKSGEIRQMLEQKGQTMSAVEAAVRKAIQEMQDSDSRGGKAIAG